MAVRQNQGFLRDFNLQETENAFVAINVLGGSGIADDLLIIRNNLRNISTISYNSLSDGFFFFGENNDFVFTNDDIVTVSTNVSVGASSLVAGQNYYICNSDARTKFKLSNTPSSVGLSTVNVTTVSPTNFNFIRRDPVYLENILNYIQPEVSDPGFEYQSSNINSTSNFIQDTTDYLSNDIKKKYKKVGDTTVIKDIIIDGVVTINDPTAYNNTVTNLATDISPGLFIGTTRAFSSDSSPWQKVGTALSTSSSLVTVGELYFDNAITVTGISTESGTNVNVTSFTHKIPVVVNGELYYILLRT